MITIKVMIIGNYSLFEFRFHLWADLYQEAIDCGILQLAN